MAIKTNNTKVKKVILVLADISGYTQFMFSNKMDLVHSHWVISQIIQTIIKQIEIPLEIAELEGDAVFMYAITDRDEKASDEIKSAVTSKLYRFIEAFAYKLNELKISNTCKCGGCRNIGKLRLKIIIHSGEAILSGIDKFIKPSGPDVIIAHKLLKNKIESNEYLLATETAYHDLNLANEFKMVSSEEYYEEIGKIPIYVNFPNMTGEYLSKAKWPVPLLLCFKQIKTSASRLLSLFLMDWWLKKRPELKDFSTSSSPRVFLNVHLAHLFSFLRIALGLVFVIGGIKIGFPTDPEALAVAYTNSESGFISPFFAEWIRMSLGISISLFLKIQGILEIFTGVMMIRGGVNTQMVALMMAVMFFVFTFATPGVGQIRLSRDLSLAGLCVAISLTGPGGWRMDGTHKYKDVVLRIIRLSLAYTLIASALFTSGVMGNPLNTTLPVELVFLLGLFLGIGVVPRWVMLPILVWLLWILAGSVMDMGIFWGFEAVKREIGLLAGSFVYLTGGPDRWAWPKKSI